MIYLNRDFRTHGGADSTAVAFLCLIDADRMIAQGIIFRGGHDMTLGTKIDTQEAFLADFLVNDDISLQSPFPEKLNLRQLSCV